MTQTIEAVFNALLTLKDIDGGGACLFDPSLCELRCLFQNNLPDTFHSDAQISIPTSPLADAVKEKRPVYGLFKDLFPAFEKQLTPPNETAILPLVYPNRTWGVFVLSSDKERAFNTLLRKWLGFIVKLTASFLYRRFESHRLQLHNQVENMVHENVNRLLNLAPGEICGGIDLSLKQVGETFQAKRVTLMLPNNTAHGGPPLHLHIWDADHNESDFQKMLLTLPQASLHEFLNRPENKPYCLYRKVSDIANIHHGLAHFLQELQTTSLVVVSIYQGSDTLGWLLLDSLSIQAEWLEELLQLLNIFASALAGLLIRERSQNALKEQIQISEEKNIAIEQIATRLREQKDRIQLEVTMNAENVLLPMLRRIRLLPGSAPLAAHFDTIESAVRDLGSQYGSTIKDRQNPLSPRELEICNFIRCGMNSKEIAQTLGISFRSVENHRHRIRKKLSLNRQTNLSSYLSQI